MWDAAEAGEELSLGAIWDHQVRSRRTAEFLVFGDPDTGQVRTYSYGEFDAWVNQVAHVLTDAGVGQRTRVAVHLYNSPEFIACLLALAKIGGVLVPISPAYSRVECADIVAHTTPLVLVTEPELLAIHGDEQLAAIGTVLSLGGATRNTSPAGCSTSPPRWGRRHPSPACIRRWTGRTCWR